MIHTHSLGRAARYYPQQTALVSEGKRLTFREAHDRVENIAAALSRHGFQKGDRLAILLPNEPELGDSSGNAELLHLGNEGGALEAKPGRGALETANDPVRFRQGLNDMFTFGILQRHGP